MTQKFLTFPINAVLSMQYCPVLHEIQEHNFVPTFCCRWIEDTYQLIATPGTVPHETVYFIC